MNSVKEHADIIAFHPGYYIAEIIEDMNISQAEFAARMGTSTKTLSLLINGQSNITNDLAKKLSLMLGTSVELWQNLQNTYDQKLIEIQQNKDFEEQEEIARLLDYKYFVEVAGLSSTRDNHVRISNLCRFLQVSDLRILKAPDYLVNFRTGVSEVSEKNRISSGAWIQTAINLAREIDTKPYDAKKLKGFLPELRSMTIQDPSVFLPRMKEIFAECGVAFILLPHLKNSGVNGAVKWISSERVVLAMNNRGVTADKFWFSLFHEIKHVLQQKNTTTFVSGSEEAMIEVNEKLEEEADRFARNYLIPAAEYRKFSPSRYTSDEEIVNFAGAIGVHPGIVAGRMQHDGIIPQNRCAKLKEKYVLSSEKNLKR